MRVAETAEKPLLTQAELNKKPSYLQLKRLQDIVLSLIALVVLFPVMLLIALIIVIDSPGASPIFVQKRVGLNGREFYFYKFRSMCANADAMKDQLLPRNEMDGPVFKIKNDPRITKVGRILRRSSLDELPQLVNILRGDMTLVGPRPALPREVAEYTDYDAQRLLVTPGLTCYWQIQPHRNDLSFHEWVDLDIRYIKERSHRTDWKIILATFGAVLGMDGE
ncbi:MAG: sugar transferase [Oscillospiraceae bacterium]|nr:sugar transferase [Oscillospiraceae bacterium]